MGSGSSTCPHTRPSFSPPSTSGSSSTSRSPTATLRLLPIWNARSQTVAGSSKAISSASGQTSIGGPSQPPRANQPEIVSLVHIKRLPPDRAAAKGTTTDSKDSKGSGWTLTEPSTPTVNGSGSVPGRSDPHSDGPPVKLAPQSVSVWPDPHSDRPAVSFPGPVGRPGTPCGEVLPRRCL